MLRLRVEDDIARQLDEWADRLGLERAQLLRDAVRRHLQHLGGDVDPGSWLNDRLVDPGSWLNDRLDDGDLLRTDLENWGPSENWSDWADAPS